jgi:hypothetical protein
MAQSQPVTISQRTYNRIIKENRNYKQEMSTVKESLDLLSQQLSQNRWIELTGDSKNEDFNQTDRKTIAQWAQIYYIKNPLIGLAVNLKTTFVFGKGVTIKAKHPMVEEVIMDFWDDDDNKAELTSLEAQQLKSNTLQLDGNIFLTLFVKLDNGRVKISSIPQDEIEDIIMHPENRRKPLWYKRTYMKEHFDYASGTYISNGSVTEYYRDWKNTDPKDKQYDPPTDKIAKDAAGDEIKIYHKKVNCTDKQKFGFSETYRAHDWAKAYTDFLQDLASIWKSLSIFASERKLKNGTSGQIAAAKAATRTYNNDGSTANKLPAAGATRISNDNDTWSPIKTNGVTMSADDGRRLLLMVCAAMGIFEHYFGDGSNANLASTTSMELPMLKMFEARQSLFEDMFRDLFSFVIRESAKARSGKLHGYAQWEDESGNILTGEIGDENSNAKLLLIDDEETDEKAGEPTEMSKLVQVDLPPITTKDVVALVGALKTALTLDGNPMTQTPMITAKQAAREFMTLMNIDGADEILSELYPENGEDEMGELDPDPLTGLTDPTIGKQKLVPMPSADQLLTQREAMLIQALSIVKEAMRMVATNAPNKIAS